MARIQKDILDLINSAQVHNRQRIRNDIIDVLEHSLSHLSLKLSLYDFADGSSEELLCLVGIIKIEYKSKCNRYNIPVELWIPQNYPYPAPMCYVKPTPNMHIAVNTHVDQNGAIHIPYLENWNQFQLFLVYTNSSDSSSNNKSTNSDSSGNNKCVICFDADIDCVVLECGHMLCCLNCSKSFQQCPICRQQVQRVKKIYKS
ncbi:unnamed protein product [Didymodactylos carnosus]|uniref:Uncharacterized protein n=1 Tax=Didymodactylos carnosus TaxID=1234261 RepID=A0A814UDJ9_9BILA|nr:unnamed protein product [Didymodactylos carnosus]CAF3934539.1 unnamed protein product [Didymodactylos carnosus]